MKVKDRKGKHSSRRASEVRTVVNFELTWHSSRVKQRVAELERSVEDLTKQLIASKLENDSLKAKNQLAPPGCVPQRMAPESIPIVPDESYPGVEVVIQRRNLQASQYVPSASQFSQSLVVQPPTGTGEQTPNSYSRTIC